MREHAETRDRQQTPLNDEELVALASLYHFDPKLVTDDAAFADALAGRAQAALDSLGKTWFATPQEVRNAKETFARIESAPKTSPPSEEARRRFLDIMADLSPKPPALPAAPPPR